MEFLNEQVPVDQLPKQEQVELSPIEADYLQVLRWEWRIGSAVLGVIAGLLLYFVPAFQQPMWRMVLPGIWLALVAAWLLLMSKSFHSRAYALRTKDIIYRKGWIIQSTHTCPFNRIQHVAVTMGPFERRYGLACLVLYTAGSDDADLRIRGLKEEMANDIKEWITKKLDDEPDTDTATPTE